VAKRKLSKQQKRRINQSQKAITLDHEDHHPGLVIAHQGGNVLVETASSKVLECSVRTNLGSIVCGDSVIFLNEENASPTIIAISPRQNLLQRKDGFDQIKSVAANVSQLLICLSVEPEPNLFLLDQYLLSASQQNIYPVIVLNKIDLLDNADTDPFELKKIYQPLGYTLCQTSVKTDKNIDQLKTLCQSNTSILSGVSGVGKSSLTKALLPEIDIKIGEISNFNREGKHTTRTSRLYHLQDGGQLIDTPGIRGFNPVFDPSQTISSGFIEIHHHAESCKFHNCKHTVEPQCSVITAVNNGGIATSRYQHFIRLQQEATLAC